MVVPVPVLHCGIVIPEELFLLLYNFYTLIQVAEFTGH